MEFQVELRHPEQPVAIFKCRSDQTVLNAAYEAGYLLASTCLRGGCGACRSTIISGELHALSPMSARHCHDPNDPDTPCQLLCVAAPKSDTIITTARPWRTRHKNPLSARIPG